MKVLKYQSEIDKLQSNFTNFKEQNRTAYRWTFEDIKDTRNFLPIFALEPKRNNGDFLGWGLSLFISKELAKKRYITITKDKPLAHKKLGTHIAEGVLIEDYGISNDAHLNGHVTHFEYISVSLPQSFTVVSQINE